VFAAACAAPSDLAYGAAPALALAPVAAVAPAVAVPAPYTTAEQGPAVTTIEQQPAVVSKQLHFGKTQFVSGYATGILKPAIPDFQIAVPTVLKGSVTVNAPLVKAVKEPFVVNEPVPVERRVEVPYDVPVLREQIQEVPVAVPVDRPYAVHTPVAVQGETIVNVRRTAPIVQRTHTAIQAQPAIAVAPVAVEAVQLAAPAYGVAPVAAAEVALA
jgi:hypothetical protein